MYNHTEIQRKATPRQLHAKPNCSVVFRDADEMTAFIVTVALKCYFLKAG